jgi:hypothetical protein
MRVGVLPVDVFMCGLQVWTRYPGGHLFLEIENDPVRFAAQTARQRGRRPMNNKRHTETNRLLNLALTETGIAAASTATWYVLERCMDAVVGMTDEDEDVIRTFHEVCSFATRHQRALDE